MSNAHVEGLEGCWEDGGQAAVPWASVILQGVDRLGVLDQNVARCTWIESNLLYLRVLSFYQSKSEDTLAQGLITVQESETIKLFIL